MAVSTILEDVAQYLDDKYGKGKHGFIIVAAEYAFEEFEVGWRTNLAAGADIILQDVLNEIREEKANELSRPERIKSDRCRASSRSSKDRTDVS